MAVFSLLTFAINPPRTLREFDPAHDPGLDSSRRCSMRCLLKVLIPVEAGNAAIGDGSLPKTIDSILADLKPEAAYFTDEHGKRSGFIFFDLKDASQIPSVAEPWFLASNALFAFQRTFGHRVAKGAADCIRMTVESLELDGVVRGAKGIGHFA